MTRSVEIQVIICVILCVFMVRFYIYIRLTRIIHGDIFLNKVITTIIDNRHPRRKNAKVIYKRA